MTPTLLTPEDPLFIQWLNKPARSLGLARAIQFQLREAEIQTISDLPSHSPLSLKWKGLKPKTIHYLEIVLADHGLRLETPVPYVLNQTELLALLSKPLFILGLQQRHYRALYARNIRLVADFVCYRYDQLFTLNPAFTEQDCNRIETCVLRARLRLGWRFGEEAEKEIRNTVALHWAACPGIPISETGLSPEIIAILSDKNVQIVGDLVRFRPKTVYRLLGATGFREVLGYLTRLGVWFESEL